MTLRVRFAPSPTGYLHVGGARTALFNWLLARREGGKFLLRVEDTDRARSTSESTSAIFEGLNWLGLDWDEEVVYQAHGLERHQADARRMLLAGAAYRCFCTTEELAGRRAEAEARGSAFMYDRRCDRLDEAEIERRLADGTPHTVRFRVPEGDTAWDDAVHERISFPNSAIEDFVILRSDGTPIYNLAVVSDDIEMRITLVMRGDDHISNTPKQIMLYRALGVELPRFAHVPMIHGTDGRKLSKRRGAVAVSEWSEQGILPRAMVNFLALLGWSPGGDREVMDLGEMIEAFGLDNLQKKAAVFDTQKLEWMNGQHLSRMSAAELEPDVTRGLVMAGLATNDDLSGRAEWLLALIDMLKVRARTVHDIISQAIPYFAERIEYDPEAVARQWKDPGASAELLLAARERLERVMRWDAESLEASMRDLTEERGIGSGKLFQPLRVALTGSAVSPGIFEVLIAMGRERVVRRIDDAVATLHQSST